MFLAVLPGAVPSIAERAADFLTRTRGVWLYTEDDKLAYIRETYAVDDEHARAILHEAYVIRDREFQAKATTKKKNDKAEPRCGQCGQGFMTWREAWDHETRAHAMENQLFAHGHGGG
jgi:hypothetical protein